MTSFILLIKITLDMNDLLVKAIAANAPGIAAGLFLLGNKSLVSSI